MLSLFNKGEKYEASLEELELTIKEKDIQLNKSKDFMRVQTTKISDLEDRVVLLNKMLTNKDMLIVKHEIEIKRLKEIINQKI